MTDFNEGIKQFSGAAREFCSWCDHAHDEIPDTQYAFQALAVLSKLYASAYLLPDTDAPDAPEPPRLSDVARNEITQRLARLPIQYYYMFFNPGQLDDNEQVAGDLLDDFGDIYSDVSRGLWLYDNGHVQAATWEWRFSFGAHWGHHATDAMYALHAHEALKGSE